MNKLCPKHVTEDRGGQILCDKIENVPKVGLQMTGQDKDLESECLLDIQKKLNKVLKMKNRNTNDNPERVFFWIYKRGL